MEAPLPAERHQRIEALLLEGRAVRVSRLAELLGVSEVTVRRDLEELERRGVLERTHGGAIPAQRLRAEPAYLEAAARNPVQKRAIGELAASLADPGDTIFLNGGTTTLEVFRHIVDPRIRIVTNHVGIAIEAAERPGETILAGGEYRAPSNSCVGSFAVEAIRKVFATRAFLGVEGISRRAGLTTPASREAEIARTMVEQTNGPVVVVADSSKFGTVADFAVAPIAEIAVLVTDAGIDDDLRDDLTRLGTEVMVADERVGAPSRGA